jgi:hypothetical protein
MARRAGLLLFAALAVPAPPAALAEIVKPVSIESTPPGAEVFLLEGTRKTPLGTTPVKPDLEFNSEVSVLRLTLTKSGFQTETVEVSARQSALKVSLKPQRIAALPTEVPAGPLREVQARVHKRIDEVLGRALASAAARDWELAGTVRVVGLEGGTWLLAPVSARKLPPLESSAAAGEVWDRIRASLVQPLGEVARGEREIKGVVVSVGASEVRRDFAVGSQVESRLEMQCVPGTEIQQQYDACARRVPVYDGTRNTGLTRCEGGTVMRQVFNPCMTKTPVTKSVVAVKPQATSRTDQAQLFFAVPAAALVDLKGRRELTAQIGVLRTDSQGKVLESRGPVPAPLPKIQ